MRYSIRWLLVLVILIVISACNLPSLIRAASQATETPLTPVHAPSATLTVSPSSTASPTLTLTATPSAPTLTATPSVATLTLTMNANCRRGPSQVYDVLTSLLAGQSVPLKGQNADGTWWLVQIPTKALCWISAVTATTSGNVAALPVATGQLGCNVLDSSGDEVCTIPCPKKNPKPADVCTP